MCILAMQQCSVSSGSEGDTMSKGNSPQEGIIERANPLGATPKGNPPSGLAAKGNPPPGLPAKGNPPPGLAAKGNPLHKQPNAYMKPKQDDLAYVPASASQKRDTQQKVRVYILLTTCTQLLYLVAFVADS